MCGLNQRRGVPGGRWPFDVFGRKVVKPFGAKNSFHLLALAELGNADGFNTMCRGTAATTLRQGKMSSKASRYAVENVACGIMKRVRGTSDLRRGTSTVSCFGTGGSLPLNVGWCCCFLRAHDCPTRGGGASSLFGFLRHLVFSGGLVGTRPCHAYCCEVGREGAKQFLRNCLLAVDFLRIVLWPTAVYCIQGHLFWRQWRSSFCCGGFECSQLVQSVSFSSVSISSVSFS